MSPRTAPRRRTWQTGLALAVLAAGLPLAAQRGLLGGEGDLVLQAGSAREACAAPAPTPTDPPATTAGRGRATASASPTSSPSSPTASPTASPTDPPTTTPPTPGGTIRVVEANIKSGEADKKFAADLRKVFKQQPDFVAFNEVPLRRDAVLAPGDYEIFRTPGKYTGEAPVVWNAARWTAIARGTTMISDTYGKEPGQHVDWGVRYANWVTVRSLDGCQTLSMVATHLAPENSYTKNLMAPSVARLGALTAMLSASGPVIVAGDFNRHYKSAKYPRNELTAAGLTPTYDIAGTWFPTGDHFGATIDYIFLHPASDFTFIEHGATEAYSDHDIVHAVLGLPVTTTPGPAVSFAQARTVNDPLSTVTLARRAVLRNALRALKSAPEGALVRILSARIDDRYLGKEIRRAVARGVRVRVVSGSAEPTAVEQHLATQLGSDPAAPSWLLFRPSAYAAGGLPSTGLAVSATGLTENFSMVVDKALDATIAREPAEGDLAVSAQRYKALVKQFKQAAAAAARG